MKKTNQFKSLVISLAVALGFSPFVPITAFAAPADSVAPTVSVTNPSGGSTVSGTVSITANATDVYSNCVVTLFTKLFDVTALQSGHPGGNIFVCGTDMTATYQGMHGTDLTRMNPFAIPTTYTGVTKVEFYIDGTLLGTDTASPYSFSWNTTASTNGSHAITAKAYDGTNTKTSSAVNVTVNNAVSNPAPTATITLPANNSTVSGTVSVAANATGSPSVSKVEFYLDGTLVFTDTVSPYSFDLNTASYANGSHTLQAKAYDSTVTVGNSTLVNINILNSSTTPPPTTTTTPPNCRKHHDDDDDEGEHEQENEHLGRNRGNNSEIRNAIKTKKAELSRLNRMLREQEDD